MSKYLGWACERRLVLSVHVCHMGRCWHVSITVHMLVYVCAFGCVPGHLSDYVHSCGCYWVYMCVVSICKRVCVCVCGCWHVWYWVSVSASVCTYVDMSVCACHCMSVPPLVLPPPTAAGPAGDSPRAPLTAVFYHHLPRKGAQEDGDK